MTYEQIMLWGFAFYVLTLLVIMQWNNKLPTAQGLQDLCAALNSRGGNILTLGGFSILFFVAALRFTYWMIIRSDGSATITKESALGMAAFSWMTGSAFGGAFTSMVKAMTGESSKGRETDFPLTGRKFRSEEHIINVTNSLVPSGSGE